MLLTRQIRKSSDEMTDFPLSLDEVWNLVEPAIPDVLLELQPGVYEALWWYPVPWEEVEILLCSEVILLQHQYEAPKLSNGWAVRFSIRRLT